MAQGRSFLLGTRHLGKWKFMAVRNSPVFTETDFKSPSENASPTPVHCHGAPVPGGRAAGLQERGEGISEMIFSCIVPQPPIY